jgi:hypothetical protein
MVEEITHAVHEDASRASPAEWEREPLRVERDLDEGLASEAFG